MRFTCGVTGSFSLIKCDSIDPLVPYDHSCLGAITEHPNQSVMQSIPNVMVSMYTELYCAFIMRYHSVISLGWLQRWLKVLLTPLGGRLLSVTLWTSLSHPYFRTPWSGFPSFPAALVVPGAEKRKKYRIKVPKTGQDFVEGPQLPKSRVTLLPLPITHRSRNSHGRNYRFSSGNMLDQSVFPRDGFRCASRKIIDNRHNKHGS